MKYRSDFVTNSSSSSFVIAKDSVKSKKALKKMLYKFAKKEAKLLEFYDEFENEKEFKRYVKSRYGVKKVTKKKPYTYNDKVYTKHYLVDNEGNGRYNRKDIEVYMGKKGIGIEWTYCD